MYSERRNLSALFFPFITVAGSERLVHTSETVFILMEDLHKADIGLLSS